MELGSHERAHASEPPERSGAKGAPASDGERGAGGTKSPGLKTLDADEVRALAGQDGVHGYEDNDRAAGNQRA